MKRVVVLSLIFLNLSFSQDFNEEELLGNWSVIGAKIGYLGCPRPQINTNQFKTWSLEFTKSKQLYLYFVKEGSTQIQELHLRWELDGFYDDIVHTYNYNDKELFVIKLTALQDERMKANFETFILFLEK